MRTHLPLKALRAFEASARHLNFRRAGLELNVTQAAVSQQVRGLEERLGVTLFKRLPRGLGMTDEGRALLPVLSDAFASIEATVKRLEGGHFREVLSVGVVGTFAVGWLLPRLGRFQDEHSFVELRLLTHNNLVELASEGLDLAVRFGAGHWPNTESALLLEAPLTGLCSPATAKRLSGPGDLVNEMLLRSYRDDEWSQWLATAGLEPWTLHGPVFDSSRLMVDAAIQGAGVALAPTAMFARELQSGALVQPFGVEIDAGSYWLVWSKSRSFSPAMETFRRWILQEVGRDPGTVAGPL